MPPSGDYNPAGAARGVPGQLDRRGGAIYISRTDLGRFAPRAGGPVAEWLCRGLQILVRRFDSGPGLQTKYLISQLITSLPDGTLAVRGALSV